MSFTDYVSSMQFNTKLDSPTFIMPRKPSNAEQWMQTSLQAGQVSGEGVQTTQRVKGGEDLSKSIALPPKEAWQAEPQAVTPQLL